MPRGYLKRPGNPMVDVQEEAGVPAAQRKTMKLVKINDAGVAVGCSGYTRAGEGCDARRRYDGVTRTLTTLPDFGFGAGATDISADGRTVIGRDLRRRPVGRAAIWRDGEPQLLGLLGGNSMAMADQRAGHRRRPLRRPDRLRRLHEARGRGHHDARLARARQRLAPAGGRRHQRPRRDRRRRHRSTARSTRYQLNLGACRVCVTDVQLQERELPSGTWQDVGADGTVDGNLVRVRVQVANHDDQPHVFQVKARDETRKQQIDGSRRPSRSTPGEEEWVELEWDTDGLAWKDGAPDADHVLRVRAVLGHTIYGGRSAVLKVRPRPVVLVPGALEDASAWKRYARAPAPRQPRVGGATRSPAWTPAAGPTSATRPDTLDRHSEVLESFVGRRARRGGRRAVDLVAHGLGGLIARQWIQDAHGRGRRAAR